MGQLSLPVIRDMGKDGSFIGCGHTNEHYKTRNGWYSGMVTLISSIVGILILHSYILRISKAY